MLPTVKRRGALVFKGGPPRTHIIGKGNRNQEYEILVKNAIGELMRGEGRIVCSGTTIQGMETRFKEQFDVGDIISIQHPQSLLQEDRNVTSVLSQRSLTVDRPFSSDFVSTIEYGIRKPAVSISGRTTDHGVNDMREEVTGLEDHQRSIMTKGTYQPEGDQTLTYREKVGMSYRTVSMKVDKEMSREDLLDLQTKKSHDRYC
jgi:hypothetical protein